jgi:DNA-directed RNA polymerase subunit RPC12/RpoP
MSVHCTLCFRQFREPAGESPPWECPYCHGRVGRSRSNSAPEPPVANRFAKVELTRLCARCGERYPAKEEVCPHCGGPSRAAAESHARNLRDAERGYEVEHLATKAGVIGGLCLIGIAIVWFVWGLKQGDFYLYPPGLAVIGLFALANALWREKPLRRPDGSRVGRRPRS